MSQVNRLADGGRVDRSRTLRFTFNGKSYTGHPGDTLASALLANGVHLVARSFKYHRPRGIMGAAWEETNALVQLEEGPYTLPNSVATTTELYDGLKAASQNCWPSVQFDIGAINSKFWRLLPAGFYYKTFQWPASAWKFYEQRIRGAAGMGICPTEADPDRYEKFHAHCDVLVVGTGPAGLSAALTAAQSGRRVLVLEEQPECGGDLLNSRETLDGKPAAEWVADAVAKLEAMDNVTLKTRTQATGYYDHNFLTALERVTDHQGPGRNIEQPRQRLWKIRAKEVVLATGSIERPLVFADNDRPGIMMCHAIRAYINRYGVLPGKQLVVFTNNDTAYDCALEAKAAGASVVVLDSRRNLSGARVAAAKAAGINVREGSVISGVHYSVKGGLSGVDVHQLGADGESVQGSAEKLACDLVGNSGGWTPTVSLYTQGRGKLRYDEEITHFVPDHMPGANSCHNAGSCNGVYTLAECLAQGAEAGRAALSKLGDSAEAAALPSAEAAPESQKLEPLWVVPSDQPVGEGPKKHFHEFQNDIAVSDILLAHREGYESIEHLKRYTNTGRGTDQGKTSNINALAVMAKARGLSMPEVGTTTFRPPYTPLTFGAVAGQDSRETFIPKRGTAMHACHVAAGAVFEDVGDWKRAWYYPKDGEDMHAAVQRECKAARTGVGMLDASTLGKIDIQGKDASKLLNMMYTNAWSKLGVGRCRYGLMCNEHGMIFDDGVTTRLSENHYHMTTTTGGAARVLDHLEEWLQTEWPHWEVYCTSVTEEWAVLSINGPKSRELLAELTDIDLDAEAFPFMSMREGHVAGVPARVYRISFTGELAYEVNVPAAYGKYVWETVMAHGEKYDICPYGTESMHVLRAEKGFIIVGQDTDGTLTPFDANHSWAVAKKKDCIGKRSWSRSDTAREGRKQLVGLLTVDPNEVLMEGAHVVEEVLPKPPMKMLGHVTSSYMSPNVDGGRSIAMAVIKDGFKRHGDTLQVATMDGRSIDVKVVEPIFFDKAGERSRG